MSVIQFFIFVFCSHTPPSAETIPPAGSPRISISAVPSDIRNSAVNTFRWNQQTRETSVIERVWVDLALICTPLYNETLRACFIVGKRKNVKKLMINGELVIEWKKEKSIKDVVGENICYD